MYPRVEKLDSPKLKEYILKKGDLVNEGRKISEQIEQTEKEMSDIEAQVVEYEEKVDITEQLKKGKAMAEQLKYLFKGLDEVKAEIHELKSKAVPRELKTKYEEKKALKEKLESEQNKKALKTQKWKDKIIPLGRQLAQKHLRDKYEDYDTVQLNDKGEIEISIFNHLEDFKTKFNN